MVERLLILCMLGLDFGNLVLGALYAPSFWIFMHTYVGSVYVLLIGIQLTQQSQQPLQSWSVLNSSSWLIYCRENFFCHTQVGNLYCCCQGHMNLFCLTRETTLQRHSSNNSLLSPSFLLCRKWVLYLKLSPTGCVVTIWGSTPWFLKWQCVGLLAFSVGLRSAFFQSFACNVSSMVFLASSQQYCTWS